MEWNRSETIALARATCTHCRGIGMRIGLKGTESPCSCVFRAIFSACYARFRECVERDKRLSAASLEWCNGTDGSRSYVRKTEDYIADFLHISQAALRPEDYKAF